MVWTMMLHPAMSAMTPTRRVVHTLTWHLTHPYATFGTAKSRCMDDGQTIVGKVPVARQFGSRRRIRL